MRYSNPGLRQRAEGRGQEADVMYSFIQILRIQSLRDGNFKGGVVINQGGMTVGIDRTAIPKKLMG